ncbi:MAG TPA: 3-deoxy-7-phosphoheptulonate synthase [Micromonosporaceae bacterium]
MTSVLPSPQGLTGTSNLPIWDELPAVQQPQWHHHPAYRRARQTLSAAKPLVTRSELTTLRGSLAEVAEGRAFVLQLGDCAESFYECTPWHTSAKVEVLDRLSDHMAARGGRPVVRVGRFGGQFAKPRSQPTERIGDVEMPVFRGHLVNSEVPTRAARQHDPRRMLWAYEASAKVLSWVRTHRERNEPSSEGLHPGPWSSHEALVVDYEGALVRGGSDAGSRFLGSTHLPWIGERTRQRDHAQVGLLASVDNPVGCKVGPTATAQDVVRLCELLDPDRTPGRLLLIARMGRDTVDEALPPLVTAVRDAGHPVVWLSDPMHGNTVKASIGVKTRHLTDVIAEAVAFRRVLERHGQPPGGMHLEVAAADVTECVGCTVDEEDKLATRYETLCDPRLNPEQAQALIDAWLRD